MSKKEAVKEFDTGVPEILDLKEQIRYYQIMLESDSRVILELQNKNGNLKALAERLTRTEVGLLGRIEELKKIIDDWKRKNDELRVELRAWKEALGVAVCNAI